MSWTLLDWTKHLRKRPSGGSRAGCWMQHYRFGDEQPCMRETPPMQQWEQRMRAAGRPARCAPVRLRAWRMGLNTRLPCPRAGPRRSAEETQHHLRSRQGDGPARDLWHSRLLVRHCADWRWILHCNVTRYQSSAWVVPQLREAFPNDSAPGIISEAGCSRGRRLKVLKHKSWRSQTRC